MISVSDYIAGFIAAKGVKHVFGFQGSSVIKLIESFVGAGLEYVQGFHEQASSFAADAYARVGGGIGVAIGTSGPGATNLINGIANAYFDSIPALFITGQDYYAIVAGRGNARQNGFQDLDIIGIVRPITKYAVMLSDPKRVRFEMEKAYWLATQGRPGAVLVDVPIDIQFAEIDEEALEGFVPPQEPEADLSGIDDMIDMMRSAKRPVILAGGGIRLARAASEFNSFAQKSGIPVVATLNGLDAYEDSVGFSGLFGQTAANLALLKSDLIIALGTRFGPHQTGRKKEIYTSAKLIHVDISDTEINRTFMKADIGIVADLKNFLAVLTPKLPQMDFPDWNKQVGAWKKKFHDTVCLGPKGIDPVRFVRCLMSAAAPGTIIAADVGVNQMWSAQGFDASGGKRLLNSSGLGSMGYALPAAIGASYLSELPAVALTGDGGFQMNLQELNTLSIRRNNVKCVVFNNNTLRMMRDVQSRYYGGRYHGANPKEFTCPDLEMLAKTFNLGFLRIEKESDFSKLGVAFSSKEPYLIDVRLDMEATVLNRFNDKSLNDG